MTSLLTVAFADSRCRLVQESMKSCRPGPRRIQKGLKESGVPFKWLAHKTGTFGGIANDVGVVELHDGRQVALSIFTSSNSASLPSREEVIADAAALVMRTLL